MHEQPEQPEPSIQEVSLHRHHMMHLAPSTYDAALLAAIDDERLREAQYRDIFEATTDGLDILTLDGVIVEANPALCRMIGYTYDELIGRAAYDFIPSDYHDAFAKHLQTVQVGGTYQTPAMLLHKDSTPI